MMNFYEMANLMENSQPHQETPQQMAYKWLTQDHLSIREVQNRLSQILGTTPSAAIVRSMVATILTPQVVQQRADFAAQQREQQKLARMKPCPDCGTMFTPKGMRYCPTCTKGRRVEMQGTGYLQTAPHIGPSNFRGKDSQEDTYATKHGRD